MMHLIAYAPEDGWGYAREGGRIWLVKPPYQGDRLPVSEDEVERAVTVHGYLASDLQFNTEGDLIQHLREEVVRSWPVQEAPEQLREDLLLLADPDEIDVYLEEAADWLRDGRTSDVETLIHRLFSAKTLTYPQRLRIASLHAVIRTQRHEERRVNNALMFSRAQAKARAGARGEVVDDMNTGVLRPTG